MADASSCLSDVWALANNVAGLAKMDHPAAGFSYQAVPSFKFFNRMAAAFVVPFEKGAAGVGLFRFGDDLYNEQIVSLGCANQFGLASIGLKVNCLQYRAQGLETTTAITVSFGGQAELTPHLSFGAHIVNINQPVINDWSGERVPTRVAAGIAFTPTSRVIVASELEKDLQYPATWKSGVEYQAFRKIAFRTGFNLHPQKGFFGFGFKSRRFYLDYALQFSDALGVSHQASVICQFKGT